MDPQGVSGILNNVREQWKVAIDFGTSNVITVLGGPHAWTRTVAFDGKPHLSSGVFAMENGTLVVGHEAERGAIRAPGRYEPSPKRRIDEGYVLLGEREYEVSWLIGAVLGKAYAEACACVRARVPVVVLPYPVSWGQRRRAVLAAAASAARIPAPRLVPEPIAAAFHFVTACRVAVPGGRCVLVYDLGGGTFEATILRRTSRGFDVLATRGLSDIGGNDIDAVIVGHLREQVRPDDAAWNRLTQPESTFDLQSAKELWEGVKEAKERLSRAASTVVKIPILGVDAPLGREQLETLIRPILERTIGVVQSVLADARIRPTDLVGVFPIDGSSRIPLVSTMLHRALGIAPVSIEQPHLAVALGCLAEASMAQNPRSGPPPTSTQGMPPQPPHQGMPAPTSGASRPVSSPPPYRGAPPPYIPPTSVPPSHQQRPVSPVRPPGPPPLPPSYPHPGWPPQRHP